MQSSLVKYLKSRNQRQYLVADLSMGPEHLKTKSIDSQTGKLMHFGLVPWEHLWADDLVILTVSLDECVAKLNVWKTGIENKGLGVNVKKTKSTTSGIGTDQLIDSWSLPLRRLSGWVGWLGSNSIVWTKCHHWTGHFGSAVTSLTSVPNYVCPQCWGEVRLTDWQAIHPSPHRRCIFEFYCQLLQYQCSVLKETVINNKKLCDLGAS